MTGLWAAGSVVLDISDRQQESGHNDYCAVAKCNAGSHCAVAWCADICNLNRSPAGDWTMIDRE